MAGEGFPYEGQQVASKLLKTFVARLIMLKLSEFWLAFRVEISLLEYTIDNVQLEMLEITFYFFTFYSKKMLKGKYLFTSILYL